MAREAHPRGVSDEVLEVGPARASKPSQPWMRHLPHDINVYGRELEVRPTTQGMSWAVEAVGRAARRARRAIRLQANSSDGPISTSRNDIEAAPLEREGRSHWHRSARDE